MVVAIFFEGGFGGEQKLEGRRFGAAGSGQFGEEESAAGQGGAMIGDEAPAGAVGAEVKEMGFREGAAEIDPDAAGGGAAEMAGVGGGPAGDEALPPVVIGGAGDGPIAVAPPALMALTEFARAPAPGQVAQV